MAVFTAIASAIVGAITGAGFAATFAAAGTLTLGGIATSILAGGIAMATSKALGVFKAPTMASAKDPGVKVQVAPSTDNKVPVFYGKNLTGGIIVDAGISNQNDTMTYVIVLGEKTDTGTYTIGKQFRGDQQLNFGVGSQSHVVTSVTDANSTSTNKVNGKMRVRLYAGGTAASDQIFPTVVTNKVAATTLLSTITASTSYEGLVYAVFQIDYDAEEGLTGLGQYTTEITNSLKEPGAVLSDYLLNSRYGAGLSASDLDSTSIADLTAYATEQVDFTLVGGATAQHDRWEINGMLGTYSDVFTNIDQICQACSTFFTYNPKVGKFEVVPNRTATASEVSTAYIFDDDNVIGAIDVTSTQLYAQYNELEAEYPDGTERDQTSTIYISTPSGELNANEPTNKLTTRYPICNDPARVTNLAQIDLRQSREDLVVQLDADYEAIQTDVGDIVKLTNTTYGFNQKLFRVMRVSEKESEAGMLSVSLQLLEYDAGVYTHVVVQDTADLPATGIPGWFTGIWGNIDYSNIANIISGNIIIVDDPLANIANVIPDPETGNISGNIDIGNVDIGIGGIGIGSGGGYIPSINFPITIPDIPDISEIIANINPVGSSVGSNVANTIPPTVVPIMPPAGNTTFVPGEVINITLPQPVMPPQDQQFSVGPLLPDILANIDLSMINPMGQSSVLATAPNITLAPQGTIDRATIGSVQAGLQYEEDEANFAIANSQLVNAELGQPASIISPIDIVDLGGIDYGEFSSMNDLVAYGGINSSTGQQIAFQPAREISYKEFDIDATTGKYTPNANSNVIDYVYGSGIQSTGITNLPTFSDGLKYTVSEERGNLIAQNQPTPRPPASATKAYVPDFMNVINYANSDLFTQAGVPRGFDVTNADKRISKSDAYLDIGGFF